MDADRRQLGPRNPQGVVGAGLCMCATAIAGRVEMGVAVERRAAGGLRDGHRNESGHRSGGALQEAASRSHPEKSSSPPRRAARGPSDPRASSRETLDTIL
jgi:hypothetical protein